MTRLSKAFMVVLMTSSLFGCSSPGLQYLPRPEPIQSTGSYTHEPSKIAFPTVVGDFQRSRIYQYDVEGKNVGVAYNLSDRTKPVAVTVYVHPSPSIVSIGSPESVIKTAQETMCQREFETTKQEIMAAHANASHIESDTSNGFQNLLARFEYEEVFAGKQQSLTSLLELSCYMNDKWNIKYRVTYPRSVTPPQDIQRLMIAIEKEANSTS